MINDKPEGSSCRPSVTHAYVVADPGNTDQDELEARQAIQEYVQTYLGTPQITWHFDRLLRPLWDCPFRRRPAAMRLDGLPVAVVPQVSPNPRQ
jgi:hypothetical protein